MKCMNNIVNNLIRIVEDFTLTTIQAFSHDRTERVTIKVFDDSISRKSLYHAKRL